MPTATHTESRPARLENHVGLITAAADFFATVARLYTERSAERARRNLERARHLLRVSGSSS